MTAPSGRDIVLGRVRAALSGADSGPVEVPRNYEQASPDAGTPALLRLFAQRLGGYDARVHHTEHTAEAISRVLHSHGYTRIAIPPGFDDSSLPDSGFHWVRDEPQLTPEQLAGVDAVVTAAGVAVADSGTVVLDGGPGQGRRVLSLLPDAMVVVVRAEQVVANLPAAVARLDARRPMTFISGPSATVDVELVRVEGVHGPRTLDVVITGAAH